ncbi:hypothetical protein GLYMA_01G082900v4 [Glycine max]|uniref:Uncharacterized protein n=1 Tax=Glycine max TaxID=3847 RepID=K7K2M9_SOYBN|nr:hypothetical protein JHK87_000935 [Glycine soja]KAG5068574.1 hypothetical protein JHK85_000951 [Glycine max]KAG5088305.1 hypothetical protein JHK86_000917 [Glycine max]KAH1162190.1 hypothetical protein GYH30_000893 [Glycine max]KRH75394.1 hypothetical protein GLYMA_01G082900v4 [Glycine max]
MPFDIDSMAMKPSENCCYIICTLAKYLYIQIQGCVSVSLYYLGQYLLSAKYLSSRMCVCI